MPAVFANYTRGDWRRSAAGSHDRRPCRRVLIGVSRAGLDGA